MLKCEIKLGTEYALREKRTLGTPFQRVRIIEHVRGNKWKAKWIDPNSGLVDYVESGQLIVPWKEHKAFLKDEENAERLWQHNSKGQGFRENSPIATPCCRCSKAPVSALTSYMGRLGDHRMR